MLGLNDAYLTGAPVSTGVRCYAGSLARTTAATVPDGVSKIRSGTTLGPTFSGPATPALLPHLHKLAADPRRSEKEQERDNATAKKEHVQHQRID